MARVHVESVRRHLLDVLSLEQFRCLGEAMQHVRDTITSGHADVVG